MARAIPVSKPRKQRGFTILETAFSMYITLVGVLVFCGMAVFSQKVGLQGQLRGAAYQVANDRMEVIKSKDFDNMKICTDSPFKIPMEVVASMPGQHNKKYEMQGVYTVSNLNGSVKVVSVQIKWRNASTPESKPGPWSTVTLAGAVTKPGSVTAGSITTTTAPSTTTDPATSLFSPSSMTTTTSTASATSGGSLFR